MLDTNVEVLSTVRGELLARQSNIITRTHPREALAAGLGDVGENWVQEAIEKRDALPGVEVRWHLIGTMQRSKARLASLGRPATHSGCRS